MAQTPKGTPWILPNTQSDAPVDTPLGTARKIKIFKDFCGWKSNQKKSSHKTSKHWFTKITNKLHYTGGVCMKMLHFGSETSKLKTIPRNYQSKFRIGLENMDRREHTHLGGSSNSANLWNHFTSPEVNLTCKRRLRNGKNSRIFSHAKTWKRSHYKATRHIWYKMLFNPYNKMTISVLFFLNNSHAFELWTFIIIYIQYTLPSCIFTTLKLFQYTR